MEFHSKMLPSRIPRDLTKVGSMLFWVTEERSRHKDFSLVGLLLKGRDNQPGPSWSWAQELCLPRGEQGLRSFITTWCLSSTLTQLEVDRTGFWALQCGMWASEAITYPWASMPAPSQCAFSSVSRDAVVHVGNKPGALPGPWLLGFAPV